MGGVLLSGRAVVANDVQQRSVCGMHVPDGFLDAPTSIATGAVAVAGIAVALRGARRELDDRTAPMAGLVAAFVFAAQMVNFPVGAGTSGHLLGGALAAVLVGPWTAALCLAVVLIVQGLLFADGGITALGTNITLFSVVAVGAGWLVFAGLRAVLPTRLSVVPVAAGVAALVSVPVTAAAFVGLFAVGGQVPVPLDAVLTAMLGWHVLIGVGEALITGLVVSSVVAARPDLAHCARPALEARRAALVTSTAREAAA
jgi:cobalt/nickel transport system permease protein